MKYLLIMLLTFNVYASLETCKTEINNKFNIIKPNLQYLFQRLNYPLEPDPIDIYEAKLKNLKNEAECNSFMQNRLNIVYNEWLKFKSEIENENNEVNQCQNLKELIKNVTYTQFASLTSDKRFENIFNALKCLTRGK